MSERMMIFVDRLGESPKYYASNQYGFVGATTTSVRVWGKKHDLTADVERLLAAAHAEEAKRCATDVCSYCRDGDEPDRRMYSQPPAPFWVHTFIGFDDRTEDCAAGPIHERLHRESQKKK